MMTDLSVNPIEYFLSLGWRVTSGYGMRTCPFCWGKGCAKCNWKGQKFHYGTDLGGKSLGDPIHTPLPGVVTASNYEAGGAGNYVAMRLEGAGIIQLFFHLNERRVKVGGRLKQGDVVGTNGATGNVTGAHLHYELRHDRGSLTGNGAWGDPASFRLYSDKFTPGVNVRVTASKLNVRSAPNGAIIDRWPYDTLTVIKEHNNNGIFNGGYHWWHVVGGGWLAETYLEPVKACPECARLKGLIADAVRILEGA